MALRPCGKTSVRLLRAKRARRASLLRRERFASSAWFSPEAAVEITGESKPGQEEILAGFFFYCGHLSAFSSEAPRNVSLSDKRSALSPTNGKRRV